MPLRPLASLLIWALLAACESASAPPPDADPHGRADGAPGDTLEGDTSQDPVATSLTSEVDPFVGTGTTLFNFGALYPGAHLPFGMVALSPDTTGQSVPGLGVAHAGGYLYQDDEVRGFSHIHLAGTGAGDYGLIAVLPAAGDPATLLAQGPPPNLPLDHAREAAEPGYYRLDTDIARVELTATARAGVHRYSFAPTERALLAIDVTHMIGDGRAGASEVRVDPGTGEVSGYVHNIGDFSKRFGGFGFYFVALPSRAPAAVGTWDEGGYVAGRSQASGLKSGAALIYDTREGAVIELRVGVSFVDEAGARANLDAEARGQSFDALRAAAHATWEEALGVIEVEGGDAARRRLFYTALYHAQFMPTLLTDVDGRYRGLDKAVHRAEGFNYYSDFSLWDTYRTFHPLVSLLWPERQRDFLLSLTQMAKDGGAMPVWPLATGETGSMIGTSADVVFGDAVGKGIEGVDWEAAYAAMHALATAPGPDGKPGRDNYEIWQAHGYVPADLADGSVSKTLEFAHDDYCLAQVALATGDDVEGERFIERSTWWRHHWDPAKGFLGPRDADGSVPSYDPGVFSDFYVEGTAWQYLFMVPHDAPGLVTLLGGPGPFAERLSTFMSLGTGEFDWAFPSRYYYHGNEPDLVAPWLFGFADRPALTRYWTTWLADNVYALESWGLNGNDDGGTLSSWYVFAGLGFYPLTCTGTYALSSPLFDRITVHRPRGDLVITRGADPAGGVTLDGAPFAEPALPWDSIASGATIELPPPPSSLP